MASRYFPIFSYDLPMILRGKYMIFLYFPMICLFFNSCSAFLSTQLLSPRNANRCFQKLEVFPRYANSS